MNKPDADPKARVALFAAADEPPGAPALPATAPPENATGDVGNLGNDGFGSGLGHTRRLHPLAAAQRGLVPDGDDRPAG